MGFVNSIDVVVPSFRLDENILLKILSLKKPESFFVQFFIIADNPKIKVPQSLAVSAERDDLNLVINERNLGFSETRNKGIRMGKGAWVLLLDDDIIPSPDLLLAYADKIKLHPEAIGFAGVTYFPETFNSATRAMDINGTTGHFKSACVEEHLMWSPTANMMLNRSKLDFELFNEELKNGGEDIEFLVRNCLLYKQKYISVKNAFVKHPWWNDGQMQHRRNFRYGSGAGQISSLPAIKPYTYHDFLNPVESLLLILLMGPLIVSFCSWTVLWSLVFMVISTELIISYLKAIFKGKSYSLLVAWYLFCLKNGYEAGFLWANIAEGKFSGFARRIDVSFRKQHPSWFRLNKWKIIKIILTLTSLYFIFR